MPRRPKGDVQPTFRRRIYQDWEFKLLIANARNSTITIDRLTPQQRVNLYVVAAFTGFRAGECASLTPEAFQLDGAEPSITVACTISKRRKQDKQVIPVAIAKLLRPFIQGKPANERLWPGKWYRKATDALRVDFDGIQEETAEGVLDFHAFRYSYITRTAATGASERMIMEVCRLSSSSLVTRYTHFEEAQRRAVVERIAVPRLRLA